MGQKINPVSLRLQTPTRHFDSSWYSNYFYKELINRDIFLQYYLNNFLKLLKFPGGRYSIQHLQKKTQVYNFFCYNKPSREWRSRLFGLTKKKNLTQKTRFFIKNKTEYKKKMKKTFKLKFFYITLNQIALHKIQRKITSFQNFQLWSTLIKQTSKKIPKLLNYSLNFDKFEKNVKNQKNLIILSPSKFYQIEKLNTLSEKNNKKKLYFDNFISNKPITNSSLLFLQNLFVYKILKSTIKTKTYSLGKTSNFSQNFEKLRHTRFYPSIKLNDNFSNFTSIDLKYKSHLETSLSSVYNLPIDIIPFKVKNDWQCASYLADEIVYFLEKRIAFRRLKTKILKQLSKIPQIRGVRITCSGRVGGKSKKAQRAKTECIKYGQTPLQVFSSKIDFSVKTAFTSFGSVGVKVWICYN